MGGVGLILGLFILGLGLLLAEVFVPGGFVGTVGVILLVVSISMSFRGDHAWLGVVLLVGGAILAPLTVIVALRRLTMRAAQDPEDGYSASEEGLSALLGQTGEALTVLRPSGRAKIEGRRVDVVSQSTMIPAGTKIEVIEVEGNRVVVRTRPDDPART